MDASSLPLCQFCCQNPAQINCYCSGACSQLCLICFNAHHIYEAKTGSRVESFFWGQEEVKQEKVKERCQICQKADGEFICTCETPWVTYCNGCAQVHTSNPTGLWRHSLEPLTSKHFLQSFQDLPQYYDRQYIVEKIYESISKDIAQVDQCTKEVEHIAAEVSSKVEEWKNRHLCRLLEVQNRIKANVERVRKQLEEKRYEKEFIEETRLEEIVKASDRSLLVEVQSELTLFSSEMRVEMLMKALEAVFTIKENYAVFAPVRKAATVSVKRLFGFVPESKRMLEFNIERSEVKARPIGHIPEFHKGAQMHLLPSGMLVVCGGETTEGTSSDCFVINPVSKNAAQLPSMLATRKHHGIGYMDQKVFVFGGTGVGKTHLGREMCGALRQCEALDTETRTWTPLPELLEARKRVWATQWQDRFYISGTDSPRIEMIEPRKSLITALALIAPGSITDMTYTFPYEGGLVVLKGTQVLKLHLDGSNLITQLFRSNQNFNKVTGIFPQASFDVYLLVKSVCWRLNLKDRSVTQVCSYSD